jgi:hypothetical protein
MALVSPPLARLTCERTVVFGVIARSRRAGVARIQLVKLARCQGIWGPGPQVKAIGHGPNLPLYDDNLVT